MFWNLGENKIVDLEEELKVIGENLKALEVAEEKAQQREEDYKKQLKLLTERLKSAESRWKLCKIFNKNSFFKEYLKLTSIRTCLFNLSGLSMEKRQYKNSICALMVSWAILLLRKRKLRMSTTSLTKPLSCFQRIKVCLYRYA